MNSLSPGDKVIVRSNEEEPVKVGIFENYWEHPNKADKIPVVKVGDDSLICFAIVLPYDEQIFKKLQNTSGKAGWRWLKELRNKS